MATKQPTSGPDPYRYVAGPTDPRTKGHATFRTKPPAYDDRSGTWDSGAGYERWRSNEFRPHTARRGKESVYVSHHRLLAVVECYDADEPLGDVLDDLRGRDVHHTTGSKVCNFGASPNFDEPGLEVLDHGDHSERTQAQMRAWGEDAKRAARDDGPADPDRCGRCDVESDVLWQCEDFDGVRCSEHAKLEAEDSPLEVA